MGCLAGGCACIWHIINKTYTAALLTTLPCAPVHVHGRTGYCLTILPCIPVHVYGGTGCCSTARCCPFGPQSVYSNPTDFTPLLPSTCVWQNTPVVFTELVIESTAWVAWLADVHAILATERAMSSCPAFIFHLSFIADTPEQGYMAMHHGRQSMAIEIMAFRYE
jgi:hypothetical protein